MRYGRLTDGHGREGNTVNVKQVRPEDILGPLNDVEKKNAPEWFYLSGEEDLLRSHPRVSVIGTRRPTPMGVRRTKSLCQALAEKGVVVVSGLAEGIDTVAHETVISLKGRTIAVLGTPLDKTFPSSNRSLQHLIMTEHLAISQFPTGYPSRPSNFPRRNRTMALISNATVIVEAGKTSGTMHQGWEALRLGRPLFLLESLVKDSDITWARQMLDYGAETLRRDNLATLFDFLPMGLLGADAPF